jgi:hypothetical protein
MYYKFQSSDFDRVSSHWLCLGRGCTQDCAFCGGGKSAHKLISGREKITLRSVKKVAEDIYRLHLQGIDQVSLSHDPDFLGEAYWRTFLKEIKNKEFKIGYYNEFFQLPSKAFLDGISDLAVIPQSKMVLSPLSGSEKVRRFNGKLFSNVEFFKILEHLREYSFPLDIYFSMNLPKEDNASFEKTIRMTEKIYTSYPRELLNIRNICHTIDPCSPMSINPEKYFIQNQMKSCMDYYEYCRLPPHVTSSEAIDHLRGFRPLPEKKRSIGDMVLRWQVFYEKLAGNEYKKSAREENYEWRLIKEDDFQFKVPSTFTEKKETGENWGFGEHYNSQAYEDDFDQFGIEGFLYFWTSEAIDFKQESMINLCQRISDEKIFQPGYAIEIIDSFEIDFFHYQGFLLDCRYSYPDREAGGPIHFYGFNNTDLSKTFVLIILAEQGGVDKKEEEAIQFLTDEIVGSFKFTTS